MLDRFDAKYLKEEIEKLRSISRSIKTIVEKIEKIMRKAGISP